jgi:glutathione S-transferase
MNLIKLYDLAAAESERRFSPNCWRVRMALLHKQLPFETIPWRFADKEAIAFSGQGKVPVLVIQNAGLNPDRTSDRERVIIDSWTIAEYLEDTYSDRPALFGGEIGKGLSQFITQWSFTALSYHLIRIIIMDVYNHIQEEDKDYFRKSREKLFGTSLEALCGDREQQVLKFRENLNPLRKTIELQPFLSGRSAAWSDYVVFSVFQWARAVSPFALLETNDPVYLWRERMLDLFDGEARKALGYGWEVKKK